MIANLDVVQAAGVLGVRPSWIYYAAKQGLIPHYRVGRYLRFNREEIERWLREQKAGTQDNDLRDREAGK